MFPDLDEFGGPLDIASARFFEYLSKECELRGAAVVYATHIFDQADRWATHVAFMQLDKKLSPVHRLHDYAPYQEILARTGKTVRAPPIMSTPSTRPRRGVRGSRGIREGVEPTRTS